MCLPVLVDHVGDSPSVINNLGPSVTVEVLGAQLRAGDEPLARVRKRWVLVDSWQLLARRQKLLKTEQVAVDTLSVRRSSDVLKVGVDSLAEQLNGSLGVVVRVANGLAEGDRVVGHGTGGLGAAELEAAGGSRLVGAAVLAEHLEVRELDDHLHVCVGGALELLDEALSVALVGLDAELVLADDIGEVLLGAVDLGGDLLGDVELDGGGLGEGGAHVGGGEVELVVEDDVVDIVVQAVGWGTVHHAVLAHEAGGSVVVDDELYGFVEPAVLAITVPVLVRALLEGNGGGIVKADDERGRLNGLQRLSVGGVGLEEDLAGVGPDVAVLGGESTDGWDGLGDLVDATELSLELSSVELLAIDLSEDLVELVLANNSNVLVLDRKSVV